MHNIVMKALHIFGTALSLLLVMSGANAAYKDTSNVKIHFISAWASDGGVLVQTNPQHSIDGLGCESAYWLKLSADQAGYNTVIAMLLSAHVTQMPVTVRAVDDQGTDFCRLERVILTQ